MLFESIIREDRSVVDLLNADYTFVDERLARHYGIPGVYGSRFRRVTLTDDSRRGLLGQGSILLVTSVATPDLSGRARQVGARKYPRHIRAAASAERSRTPRRTALSTKITSVRERMEAHRNNPGLRRLPQDHGPDRLLARELRSDRKLANHRSWNSDRYHRASWSTARNYPVPRACGRRS